MLGLTYLFPEEPIEEDDLFVMSQFPMPQFTTWLHDTLKEYGLTWGFAASMSWRTGHQGPVLTDPNGHEVVADYNIGCESTSQYMDIVELTKALNKRLSFWRWYDSTYKIFIYNSSSKPGRVWIHLKIANFIAPTWINRET